MNAVVVGLVYIYIYIYINSFIQNYSLYIYTLFVAVLALSIRRTCSIIIIIIMYIALQLFSGTAPLLVNLSSSLLRHGSCIRSKPYGSRRRYDSSSHSTASVDTVACFVTQIQMLD